MNDLKVAYPVILGSFFLAFILGLIYMLFVRYFAGLIVWIAIIGYFVVVLLLAIFLKTQS